MVRQKETNLPLNSIDRSSISSISLETKWSLILFWNDSAIRANRSLSAPTNPTRLKVLNMFYSKPLPAFGTSSALVHHVSARYNRAFPKVIKLSTVQLTPHRIFSFEFDVPSILLISLQIYQVSRYYCEHRCNCQATKSGMKRAQKRMHRRDSLRSLKCNVTALLSDRGIRRRRI